MATVVVHGITNERGDAEGYAYYYNGTFYPFVTLKDYHAENIVETGGNMFSQFVIGDADWYMEGVNEPSSPLDDCSYVATEPLTEFHV